MLDYSVVRRIQSRYGDALDHRIPGFRIGDVDFDFDHSRYLVGVINLSTDSWYQESIARTSAEAIERGIKLMEEGATILDIGAESTLPDAERKDVTAQLDALLPVVEPLARRGAVVSVESYHPEVLEQCAKAGARIFNLTGMREAPAVFDLASHYGAAVILCYVQGETVRDVGNLDIAEDMVPKLVDYFRDLLDTAERHGVTNCFVDPGLGFYYKNLEDSRQRVTYQFDTFLNAFRMWELNKPVFNIVPHAPEAFGPNFRRSAEPFFAVWALLGGTHVIRTHEVAALKRVLTAMEMYRP